MVEQSNEDSKRYAYHIYRIEDMYKSPSHAEEVGSIRECYGKMGLYASASDFLKLIGCARLHKESKEGLGECIKMLAFEALVVISIYKDTKPSDVIKSQLEMYHLKNKRYGNSFAECFAKDGYPYAFGHLQEKANRICSLLMLGDDANDEPIIDSYRDLFGYCILTLVEMDKL